MSNKNVNWLEPDELAAWRTFIKFDSLLMAKLDADLMSLFSISLAEYEVLVYLSEAPGMELRMSALASLCLVSRSGLTRRLERLMSEGSVEKVACETDRRGTNAQLTQKGYQRLVQAAPSHVDGVRKYFISKFSKEDLCAFTRFLLPPLTALEEFECPSSKCE